MSLSCHGQLIHRNKKIHFQTTQKYTVHLIPQLFHTECFRVDSSINVVIFLSHMHSCGEAFSMFPVNTVTVICRWKECIFAKKHLKSNHTFPSFSLEAWTSFHLQSIKSVHLVSAAGMSPEEQQNTIDREEEGWYNQIKQNKIWCRLYAVWEQVHRRKIVCRRQTKTVYCSPWGSCSACFICEALSLLSVISTKRLAEKRSPAASFSHNSRKSEYRSREQERIY